MNTKLLISIFIILFLIAGYVFTNKNTHVIPNSTNMERNESMMNEDGDSSIQEAHTMPDGTIMMDSEASVETGGHMMPDGTMMQN